MRLESAIRASQEGLTASGSAISVVGDNIANSSTTGFKTSRVEYADLYSDAYGATAESDAGDGVEIQKIRQIYDQGLVEQTGRGLDFAITGNGFFAVQDPSTSQVFYTRAGDFSVTPEGVLVNSKGYPVLGYGPNATEFGAVLTTISLSNQTTATASSVGSLSGNVDSNSPVMADIPDGITLAALGDAANFVQTVQVIDSLGAKQPILVAWTKTGTNTWTVQGFIDGGRVGGTDGEAVAIGSTQVSFTADGLPEGEPSLTINPAYAGGAAAGNVTFSLAGFTQYATESAPTAASVNGIAAGGVIGYEVSKDGTIYGILDSGGSRVLGTLAVTDFVNRDGLQRVGQNLFLAVETLTGDAIIGKAGANGLGEMSGASLERSTVDIATQFTDLILVQRAYQANSQILSASNDLLKATIAMVR